MFRLKQQQTFRYSYSSSRSRNQCLKRGRQRNQQLKQLAVEQQQQQKQQQEFCKSYKTIKDCYYDDMYGLYNSHQYSFPTIIASTPSPTIPIQSYNRFQKNNVDNLCNLKPLLQSSKKSVTSRRHQQQQQQRHYNYRFSTASSCTTSISLEENDDISNNNNNEYDNTTSTTAVFVPGIVEQDNIESKNNNNYDNIHRNIQFEIPDSNDYIVVPGLKQKQQQAFKDKFTKSNSKYNSYNNNNKKKNKTINITYKRNKIIQTESRRYKRMILSKSIAKITMGYNDLLQKVFDIQKEYTTVNETDIDIYTGTITIVLHRLIKYCRTSTSTATSTATSNSNTTFNTGTIIDNSNTTILLHDYRFALLIASIAEALVSVTTVSTKLRSKQQQQYEQQQQQEQRKQLLLLRSIDPSSIQNNIPIDPIVHNNDDHNLNYYDDSATENRQLDTDSSTSTIEDHNQQEDFRQHGQSNNNNHTNKQNNNIQQICDYKFKWRHLCNITWAIAKLGIVVVEPKKITTTAKSTTTTSNESTKNENSNHYINDSILLLSITELEDSIYTNASTLREIVTSSLSSTIDTTSTTTVKKMEQNTTGSTFYQQPNQQQYIHDNIKIIQLVTTLCEQIVTYIQYFIIHISDDSDNDNNADTTNTFTSVANSSNNTKSYNKNNSNSKQELAFVRTTMQECSNFLWSYCKMNIVTDELFQSIVQKMLHIHTIHQQKQLLQNDFKEREEQEILQQQQQQQQQNDADNSIYNNQQQETTNKINAINQQQTGKYNTSKKYTTKPNDKTYVSGQVMSNSIWSFGTSKVCNGGHQQLLHLVEQLLSNDDKLIETFDEQHLTNIAIGIAKILSNQSNTSIYFLNNNNSDNNDLDEHYTSLTILRHIALEVIRRKAIDFPPQGMSNLLWAFATVRFGFDPNSSIDSTTIDTQTVKTTSNGRRDTLKVSQYELTDDVALLNDFVNVLVKASIPIITTFNEQNIGNLTWSLGRLVLVVENTNNTVQVDLIKQLLYIIGQNVSNRNIVISSSQNNTSILWSFSTYNMNNHSSIYRGICKSLLEYCKDGSSTYFQPFEYTSIIRSFAIVDIKGINCTNAFGLRSIEKLSRLRRPTRRLIVPGGGDDNDDDVIDDNDPITMFFDIVANDVMSQSEKYGSSHISDVLWSFSKVGYYHPILFKSVANFLIDVEIENDNRDSLDYGTNNNSLHDNSYSFNDNDKYKQKQRRYKKLGIGLKYIPHDVLLDLVWAYGQQVKLSDELVRTTSLSLNVDATTMLFPPPNDNDNFTPALHINTIDKEVVKKLFQLIKRYLNQYIDERSDKQ